MVFLVAPTAFKESLSPTQASWAIARGIHKEWPEAETLLAPLADGGDGTIEALLAGVGGKRIPVRITGPLGEPAESYFGLLSDGKTAVVESASSCGLAMVPPERRDPRFTTSRGLGELLLSALEEGAQKIIVGLGGSATNDGGTGLLKALGARFLDSEGKEIPEGGGALKALAKIDLSGWRWPEPGPEIVIAADVTNPLCGPTGASAVYGPQKGATPEMVQELDQALSHFAKVAADLLGQDWKDTPGAGSAGGLGFALMAFLKGKRRSGVSVVMETIRFEEKLQRAHLVVTGEGRLDAQTTYGKAIAGVLEKTSAIGVPVVALVGSWIGDLQPLYERGLSAVMTIAPGPSDLSFLLKEADSLLEQTARTLTRLLKIGKDLPFPKNR